MGKKESNLIQFFKENASCFLYIFIAEDAIRDVFANAPVIIKKRRSQIAYVTTAAVRSNFTYKELVDIIAKQIIADYGKNPAEVLLDIAHDRNVYSLKEYPKVNSCRVGKRLKIDENTGYPVGENKNNYIKVSDSELKHPIGMYDNRTGEQVSYYDVNKLKWIAGKSRSSQDNRNMWVNNVNWTEITNNIIGIIGSISGVVQARNMTAYQSDGWYGVTQNTTHEARMNNLLPIALLAVGGYYLISDN